MPRASAATSRPSRPTRGNSSTGWTGPRSMRIEGIPPAIAIDQTNPVRTSRSTVGTMTELNDHLKLLVRARGGASLPGVRARPVRRDTRRQHPQPDRATGRRRGRPAPAADLSGAHPEKLQRKEIKALLAGAGLHANARGTRRCAAGDSGPLSLVDRGAGARRRCHRIGAEGGPRAARRLSAE